MTEAPEQKRSRSIWSFVGTMARDVCGAIGFASLLYGIEQIYVPAAWITGGAITIGICILSARGQRS